MNKIKKRAKTQGQALKQRCTRVCDSDNDTILSKKDASSKMLKPNQKM
jgi:hypothetical protein